MAAVLLACIATGAARGDGPPTGALDDPCAGVPVPPTAGEKARSDQNRNPSADPLAADFGQHCHYAAQNRALGPASPRRIVFFGDSITAAWREALPAMFAGDVLDRGISGQTTEQMLVRFRSDVIELHPAVVHIMAGTNDVAGNRGPTTMAAIEGNIRSLVELARANGITVVLGSIPPAARFPWSPAGRAAEPIIAINTWLKDYARREHVIYVDYHSALADGRGGLRAVYSRDGVHPSRAGYEVMRPLALEAVQAALVSRASAGAPTPCAGQARPR